MAIEKVNAGQPWQPPMARDWNDLANAAEAWRSTQNGMGGFPDPKVEHPGDRIRGKNKTGEQRLAGRVVAFRDKAVTTLSNRQPWHEFYDYDDTRTLHSIGITLSPVPYDEFGDVRVSGGCVARINITDNTHRYASPENGNEILQSSASGPVEIVSRDSGSTGEQDCYVLLPVCAPTLVIKYARMEEPLFPGSGAKGVLVKYDWATQDWIDEVEVEEDEETPTVTISDYQEAGDAIGDEADAEVRSGHNFILTGEVIPVRWDASFASGESPEEAASGFLAIWPPEMFPEGMFGVEGMLDWEHGAYVIVGSHGLRRYAKAKSDSPSDAGIAIRPGEWKDCVIYHKGTAGGEDEPIATDPEIGVKAMPLKGEWGARRGVKYDEGFVITFQPDQARWTIEPNDEDIQRFKLTSTLSIGGSSAAVFMDWDGAAWTESADTLTVYDSMSILCASLASGKKGHCKLYKDSDRWELI